MRDKQIRMREIERKCHPVSIPVFYRCLHECFTSIITVGGRGMHHFISIRNIDFKSASGVSFWGGQWFNEKCHCTAIINEYIWIDNQTWQCYWLMRYASLAPWYTLGQQKLQSSGHRICFLWKCWESIYGIFRHSWDGMPPYLPHNKTITLEHLLQGLESLIRI